MNFKIYGKKKSEKEIIHLIKSKQNISIALKQIYEQYYGIIKTLILTNSGNKQDAEDIFQEAIMVLIDMIQGERFAEKSSLKTLIYAICRNMWLDQLKRRSKYVIRDTHKDYELGMEPDVSLALVSSEKRNELEQVFNQLGEPCHSMLKAYYYEELSIPQLWERYKKQFKNEQVIRNKKSKCLRTLREQIGQNPAVVHSVRENLLYVV